MASRVYTPKLRSFAGNSAGNCIALGRQPYNRDNIALAFGIHAKSAARTKYADGQDLAGKGALVFEGEVLELPNFH